MGIVKCINFMYLGQPFFNGNYKCNTNDTITPF